MCNSGCETCPPRGYICVPRGDSLRVVVPVHENDCDGDLMDISGASEIVFAASDEIGGVVRFTKKLSTGGVSISTNDYEFSFVITAANSDSLVRHTNYFEIRITSAAGETKTVMAGVLKSPETIIKDIP